MAVLLVLYLIMLSLKTSAEDLLSASSDLVLVRTLLGSGFHRNLETVINVSQSIRSQHQSPDCALLLFETLPSGVYADPFQLQSLLTFGGPQVLFDRVVDIEAAEFLSKPHELLIYLPLSELDTGSNKSGLVVSLPIHARYMKPSKDASISHSVVTILHPGLYSNCSNTNAADTIMAPCDVTNSTVCKWGHLGYRSDSPLVQLHVPVGQLSDVPLVIVCTLLVTVLVCALLVRAVLTTQNYSYDKSL